jgi:CheY-like chemotaxis protein
VDDKSVITEVLQRALQGQGYQTEAVGDASAASDLLASTDFDLILCDLELPGMDGLAFYQNLTQTEPGWKDRFIFMTGELLTPSSRAFIQDTHIPVLMKPFDLDELYRSVAQSLQGPG